MGCLAAGTPRYKHALALGTCSFAQNALSAPVPTLHSIRYAGRIPAGKPGYIQLVSTDSEGNIASAV